MKTWPRWLGHLLFTPPPKSGTWKLKVNLDHGIKSLFLGRSDQFCWLLWPCKVMMRPRWPAGFSLDWSPFPLIPSLESESQLFKGLPMSSGQPVSPELPDEIEEMCLNQLHFRRSTVSRKGLRPVFELFWRWTESPDLPESCPLRSHDLDRLADQVSRRCDSGERGQLVWQIRRRWVRPSLTRPASGSDQHVVFQNSVPHYKREW